MGRPVWYADRSIWQELDVSLWTGYVLNKYFIINLKTNSMEQAIVYRNNEFILRFSNYTAIAAIVMLILLHVVSPEFEPNWRMVSEYALGRHKSIVTLFFIFWGITSCSVSISLWNVVSTKAAKTGVI